ncbi:hypothetical protein HDA32_001659 [Spinactinospora alkalitolerans]|uniref:Uncharacterized protein n=1 Tax=Spinactinospora alkalitolerans TaxID=687207 RepID=A0A852TRB6_9ACTN|nr:hypothetical protein [Spinactinospora alkalitolerans]
MTTQFLPVESLQVRYTVALPGIWAELTTEWPDPQTPL